MSPSVSPHEFRPLGWRDRWRLWRGKPGARCVRCYRTPAQHKKDQQMRRWVAARPLDDRRRVP